MGVDEKLKNYHLRQHIGSIKHKQFMHHDVSIILDRILWQWDHEAKSHLTKTKIITNKTYFHKRTTFVTMGFR